MSKAVLARCLVAVAAAGGIAVLSSGSTAAAPAWSGTAVKAAAATGVLDVRSRRYWGWRRYGAYRSGCHVAGGYNRPNGCW